MIINIIHKVSMIIDGENVCIFIEIILIGLFFLEKIKIEPGSFSVCVWFPAGVLWHPTDAEVRET